MAEPPVIHPLLEPFRMMRNHRPEGGGAPMILEGPALLRRALEAGLTPSCVLCERGKHKDLLHSLESRIPLFEESAETIAALCGFNFHRGILATAPCPELPDRLDGLTAGPVPLLVLPEINDAENLGSLLRAAAAFGVPAVLLGERCTTPFNRRSLRVSMGAAFELRLVHCRNLARELERLRELGLVLLGSSARQGQPPRSLELAPERPCALLVGNEGQGLSPESMAACDHLLRIPMASRVSSLNVAMATGILLYDLANRCAGPSPDLPPAAMPG
ncbi:MAG: RNA methyltransferase [Candidatus Cloacimonetes bacterium]|nr:RNA methyltransferase [Candidatus Cloacimonadota bacterium]